MIFNLGSAQEARTQQKNRWKSIPNTRLVWSRLLPSQ